MTVLESTPTQGVVLPTGWSFGILTISRRNHFGRWFQSEDGSVEEYDGKRSFAQWEVTSFTELAMVPKSNLDELAAAQNTCILAPMLNAISNAVFEARDLTDRHLS